MQKLILFLPIILSATTKIDGISPRTPVSKLDSISSFNVAMADLHNLLNPHRNFVKQWFGQLITDKNRPRAEYLTCDICNPAIALVRAQLGFGVSEEMIIQSIIQLCVILEFAPSPDLCEPTIRSYARAALYIAKHRKNMSDDDFCGILNPGCKNVNPMYVNWTTEISGSKPPASEKPLLPANLPTVEILQFTDIHIDLHYTEGANADCEYPICCRATDGIPGTNESMAGPYGHYKCALPEKTVREIIRHARETHNNVKYIFVTGDYIHAGAWQYSAEENAKHISTVLNIIAEYFPNTPTYPLVGNHEPDTGNLFPPPELWSEFDLLWLYTNTSAPFLKWFTHEQLNTFHYGGYFTVSPEPGLRIVALNTNICYINNFWLAYDPIDPLEQLQWFANTLQQAEFNDERVYIIGHIPPGDSWCWPIWSNQFDLILNRFAHLVQGQFYGHAHTEYFSLTFERETTRPISVSYNSPSQLTDGMDSGYKVYHVDGARQNESSWEILDHNTWVLKLEETNALNTPVWEMLFSAKNIFELESLRPDTMEDFIFRMAKNSTLFEILHRYFRKNASDYTPCPDTQCVADILCYTMTTNSDDDTHCQRITEAIHKYSYDVGSGSHLQMSFRIAGLTLPILSYVLIWLVH